MPSATFLNVDGEIVAENRAGTLRDYVPNSLGSTVALLDSSQAKTHTYDYWPYGEETATSSRGGTNFRFGGTRGCWRQSWDASVWVRRRVEAAALGRWTTTDPLWPKEPAYEYAKSSPSTDVDESGLQLLQCVPSPCDWCAAAILARWFPTKAHYNRHKYAHCMACCVLDALAGIHCASDKQELQNLVMDPPWSVAKKNSRRHFCAIGIAAGEQGPSDGLSTHFGYCSKACSAWLERPFPYSLPALPECEPTFYPSRTVGLREWK